jgi:hypothetical protein
MCRDGNFMTMGPFETRNLNRTLAFPKCNSKAK